MLRRPPTRHESRATNTAGSRDLAASAGPTLDSFTPGNVDPSQRDDTGLQTATGLGQGPAPTDTGFLNGKGGMFATPEWAKSLAINKTSPRFKAQATAIESRQRLLTLGRQIQETRSAI